MILLAVHQSREAHAGFFEVPLLEDSERGFYVRLLWMWRIFVYLPALAIGFFAYVRPTLLCIFAYALSAIVLSFDGHGPYKFEDSAASLMIFGDTHHYLLPSVSHAELIVHILVDDGKVLLIAGVLSWLGARLRLRLNNRLGPLVPKQSERERS